MYDILKKITCVIVVLCLILPVLFVSESTAGKGGELEVPTDLKIQFGETKKKDKESKSKAGHGGKLSFGYAHEGGGAVTSYDGRTLTINPEAGIGAVTTITVTEAAKGDNAKQEKSFKVQIVPRPIYVNMRGMYVVGNLPEWGRHWDDTGEDRTYSNVINEKLIANGFTLRVEPQETFWHDLPAGSQLDIIAGPQPRGLTFDQWITSLDRIKCEMNNPDEEYSFHDFGIYIEVFQERNYNPVDGNQFMVILMADKQWIPTSTFCGQKRGEMDSRIFIVQESGINKEVWHRKVNKYYIQQNGKFLEWRP